MLNARELQPRTRPTENLSEREAPSIIIIPRRGTNALRMREAKCRLALTISRARLRLRSLRGCAALMCGRRMRNRESDRAYLPWKIPLLSCPGPSFALSLSRGTRYFFRRNATILIPPFLPSPYHLLSLSLSLFFRSFYFVSARTARSAGKLLKSRYLPLCGAAAAAFFLYLEFLRARNF